MLASAFAAGTTLLAKALGTDALGAPLHALQVSHGRFLFAFLAISLAALVLRPQFTAINLKIHVARSVFGWLGVTCMFAAAAFMALSDATAISFLNPVFAMLLAIPFLGEKVGPWRWLAAGTAMIGALILLRPTPDSFQPAALLALTSAFLFGGELIFIKRLAGREGPHQILLVNNVIGLSLSTIAVLFVWSSPTPAQWAALAGIGVLMAGAQTCFVNAMARADASFVAPFFYATLTFAALYDALIFRVMPDAISILGAGVILAGALLLGLRDARNPQASPPAGES